MTREEAIAGMEELDRAKSRRVSMLSYLPSLLAASYAMGGTALGLGLHRGECRRPKNLDSSKNRAPGMKEFWVRDGVVVWRPGDPPESPDGAMLIWAGTEKAALKKYRLLVNSHLSNGQ